MSRLKVCGGCVDIYVHSGVNTASGMMDEQKEISPSLCLPPSRGAITADTESTITALTDPPPTLA